MVDKLSTINEYSFSRTQCNLKIPVHQQTLNRSNILNPSDFICRYSLVSASGLTALSPTPSTNGVSLCRLRSI